MRISLASIGLSLLLAPWHGQAAPAPADTNFFPIMAWNWAPKDPAVLQTMREGGLTVAGFVSPDTLDACQAAGLKVQRADGVSSLSPAA